ncbi:MAG: hypothetical protein PUC05_07135 [Firmicutes bacterium]|nr:hypothetical protein [Bacillota bacterium]
MRVNTIIFDAVNFNSVQELRRAFSMLTTEQTVRLRGRFDFNVCEDALRGGERACIVLERREMNIDASEAVINLFLHDVSGEACGLYVAPSAQGVAVRGLSLNVYGADKKSRSLTGVLAEGSGIMLENARITVQSKSAELVTGIAMGKGAYGADLFGCRVGVFGGASGQYLRGISSVADDCCFFGNRISVRAQQGGYENPEGRTSGAVGIIDDGEASLWRGNSVFADAAECTGAFLGGRDISLSGGRILLHGMYCSAAESPGGKNYISGNTVKCRREAIKPEYSGSMGVLRGCEPRQSAAQRYRGKYFV